MACPWQVDLGFGFPKFGNAMRRSKESEGGRHGPSAGSSMIGISSGSAMGNFLLCCVEVKVEDVGSRITHGASFQTDLH
jgi:hypothetical protein